MCAHHHIYPFTGGMIVGHGKAMIPEIALQSQIRLTRSVVRAARVVPLSLALERQIPPTMTPKIIAAKPSRKTPAPRWSLGLVTVGNMPGLPSSSRPVIDLHPVINVHTGDFVAGLLGGGVVLLGALLTEALVRHRERVRRLQEAAWAAQAAASGGLMIGHIPEEWSGDQLARALTDFSQQLGRVKREAHWPIRHAKEIRAEVDRIREDLMVATAKMGMGKAGPPALGPILGEKLLGLILREKGLTQQRLNERLRAEGVPTLDDLDASHNAPKPPQAGAA